MKALLLAGVLQHNDQRLLQSGETESGTSSGTIVVPAQPQYCIKDSTNTQLGQGPYLACCSEGTQCLSDFCLIKAESDPVVGRCNESCVTATVDEDGVKDNGVGICCDANTDCFTNLCEYGRCESSCPLIDLLLTDRSAGACCDIDDHCSEGYSCHVAEKKCKVTSQPGTITVESEVNEDDKDQDQEKADDKDEKNRAQAIFDILNNGEDKDFVEPDDPVEGLYDRLILAVVTLGSLCFLYFLIGCICKCKKSKCCQALCRRKPKSLSTAKKEKKPKKEKAPEKTAPEKSEPVEESDAAGGGYQFRDRDDRVIQESRPVPADGETNIYKNSNATSANMLPPAMPEEPSVHQEQQQQQHKPPPGNTGNLFGDRGASSQAAAAGDHGKKKPSGLGNLFGDKKAPENKKEEAYNPVDPNAFNFNTKSREDAYKVVDPNDVDFKEVPGFHQPDSQV